MTPEQARRNLYQKSLAYQEQVKKYLNEQVGPQRRLMDGGPDQYKQAVERMGGFVWNYGQTPNDAQVRDYIARTGGNPYTKALQQLQQKLQGQAATSTRPTTRAAQRAFQKRQKEIVKQAEAEAAATPMETLIAEYKKANDAAFAANESRYNQGLQELTDLRTRTMDRASQFGDSMRDDLNLRASKSGAEVQAQLADLGLMNSSSRPAFEHQNAVDLAREQVRLGDLLNDRTTQYDQNLTNNLVGFVERRNDVPPDYSQLYALAEKYGAAGQGGAGGSAVSASGGQQAATGQAPQDITVSVPRRGMPNLPYAASAEGAAMIAGNTLGQMPVMTTDMGQYFNLPQATTSNRYPMTRTPAEYLGIATNNLVNRNTNRNAARAANMRYNLYRPDRTISPYQQMDWRYA